MMFVARVQVQIKRSEVVLMSALCAVIFRTPKENVRQESTCAKAAAGF